MKTVFVFAILTVIFTVIVTVMLHPAPMPPKPRAVCGVTVSCPKLLNCTDHYLRPYLGETYNYNKMMQIANDAAKHCNPNAIAVATRTGIRYEIIGGITESLK
ncbi:uncharacterized protein [Prorops nasuta]|uniref:uncharacterized protein n=1 Tax=Prorops nasuta TaxID=863751 RepID=UPI0034CD036E